jgi:hypothetical protein
MCSPSSPPAPDPIATAQAQANINKDAIATSARFNRTNQNTPYGSLTYSGTAGEADDTLTTSLSPELMNLLNGQLGISQGLTDQSLNRLGGIPSENFTLDGAPSVRAGAYAPIADSFDKGRALQYDIGDAGQIQKSLGPSGQIQTGVNLNGLPQIGTNFGDQLTQASDAAYNSQARYLDPQFQRQEQAMQSQLAAQGITQGSEAYNDAIKQFSENKDRSYQGARDSAFLAGTGLQNQLFGQNVTARQQGVSEQFGLGDFRNQAQNQQFGQNLAAGQFGNDAQQQLFAQLAAQQQAYNQTAGQDYAQNMGAAQFGNDANMLKFQQNNTLRDQDLQNRQNYINENVLARNQNFNELAAFLNGSPVSPNTPLQFQGPTNYQAAQGSPDAVGLAAGNYSAAQQAKGGILGGLFSGLGALGGAGIIAACWVAREVYGVENMDWVRFRGWLFNKAPTWFCALYIKHGERFAEWLRDKPRIKAVIRRWMDARIKGSHNG